MTTVPGVTASPPGPNADALSWKGVALAAGKTFVGSVLLGALGALTATLVAFVATSDLRAVGMGWLRPVVATIVLVSCAVLVPPLAIKRAVARGLELAVKRLGFGARLFRLVIDRMLRVDETAAMGERGNAVARATERLPLAQAEARLRDAVGAVLRSPAEDASAPGAGGWIRTKVRSTLLANIERVTLARFRERGSTEGGVDLVRVRDELGPEIDALLAARVASGGRTVTVAIATLMSLLAFGVPWLAPRVVIALMHLRH